MIFKYLFPVIFLLSSCRQNIDFLHRFRDRGELAPKCIAELDSKPIIVGMSSMVKSGEYIVWNKYNTSKGTMLYAYHLPTDSLIEISMPLRDSTHFYHPEMLFACNDSVISSLNEQYQYFSYIHLKDSVYISGYRNLNIINEEFFDWKGKAMLRSVCPGEDSLFFVGCIGTKTVDYGVFDGTTRFLYPSYTCIPPTAFEMKCLLPDHKDNISVIRQKGGNRYAVFRQSYQLCDVIDMRGNTLHLIKRNISHHSLLTWTDQYNLQQDLTHTFFPGFFVQSPRYIITLYESFPEKEKRQYLLVCDWEGKPLYSYRFPKDFEVYGLCGNEDDTLYAAGKMRRGQAGLFKIKYQ